MNIGDTVGPYRVLGKIGEGGMGEVYRATDTRLRRGVAIKVLPAALTADRDRLVRFEREAQLLASLNHPNIAHVYGFESAALPDGSAGHFIAMELVEGENLAERLQRGAMTVDEAIAVAKQISEALEAAHERGIVHRDLKPANIKITPDGRVKVLDFGLAKAMESTTQHLDVTSAHELNSPTLAYTGTEVGVILGTAAYMAPEQARGKAVDKRADIWAFGAVLYEMLTGKRLFEGETLSDLMAATLRQEIDWSALPATTPADVRKLLRRCLERDAQRRLRDIGEARITLTEPAREETPASIPGMSTGRRFTWMLPWALAAGGIAVASWALWQTPQSSAVPRDVVHIDIGVPPDVEPVAGRQGGIAISPDGKSIAMVGFTNGQRRLFVRRLDATEAVDVAGTSSGGAFSPDGGSVAFISNATVLTRVSLADGQAVGITSGGDFAPGLNLAWGQKHVFFISGGSLWRAPADGGASQQLTSLDNTLGELLHADPLAASRRTIPAVHAPDDRARPADRIDSAGRREAGGGSGGRHDTGMVADGAPPLRTRSRRLGRAVRSGDGDGTRSSGPGDSCRGRRDGAFGKPWLSTLGQRDARVRSDRLRQQTLRLRRPRWVGAPARSAARQLRQSTDLARRTAHRPRTRGKRPRRDRPRARHARRHRPGRGRHELSALDERWREARRPAFQRPVLGRRRWQRKSGGGPTLRCQHVSIVSRARRRFFPGRSAPPGNRW